MDLRLLEYFVAVAECEHVGRAAERLHISQSPLSRQIRQLEDDLQLELFVRERQRIRLTESGRWLLGQAQALLAHSEKVGQAAKQRSRGKLGTLTIAFTSAAMWSGLLPTALRRFQAALPDVKVELLSMRSAAQMDAVQSGRADIGFVATPATASEVETRCVSEEPSLLVVPGTHALARKRNILPRDLDGLPWIMLTEANRAENYDRFLAACQQAGFTPQVAQKVMEPMTMVALVANGLGVGLIRSSGREYAPGSLVFKSLPWFPVRHRTYMIRPAAGRQPIADKFTAYLPQIATIS